MRPKAEKVAWAMAESGPPELRGTSNEHRAKGVGARGMWDTGWECSQSATTYSWYKMFGRSNKKFINLQEVDYE